MAFSLHYERLGWGAFFIKLDLTYSIQRIYTPVHAVV